MENNQASGVTPATVDQKKNNNDRTQLHPDWYASKKSLQERNAVMLNNDLLADVYFIVGSGSTKRRIPAHKYILVTGSSVFHAMFCGGLPEEKEVAIPDVEPQAFLNLLKYLYCDEISLEADNALPTLYAAKKYLVPHLVRTCIEYLETNVDASNACLLLSHSCLFEETELMQHCLYIIDSQTEEAIQSDSFFDIDYQTLEQILVRDTLNIKEAVLFAATKRWTEAECIRQGRDTSPQQHREVLGDALYLLRFPTMTPGEFADGACQSGILNNLEIIDVFRYFSANTKPKLRFPTTCRKAPTLHCCRRYPFNTSGWVYSKHDESIGFSVDKTIFVLGFGLFGSSAGAAVYDIDISLKYNGNVLRQKKESMHSNGTNSTYRVLFDYPVRIESHTYYTATLILKDANKTGHFGISGKSHVKCRDANFTFRNISGALGDTNIETGQIPEILFYH